MIDILYYICNCLFTDTSGDDEEGPAPTATFFRAGGARNALFVDIICMSHFECFYYYIVLVHE